MTLEALMKKGLTEEQAKLVLQLHKEAIDGNYVPKATFDAEREKVKDANNTIADRDKQITELGKFKGTAEELQKKVDDLTAENDKAKKEYEDKLKDMETNSAIRSAIADQVHNVDDIMPRIDKTKLTITDGKVTAGLVEQVDAVKKSHPHYFKESAGNNSNNNNNGFPGGWHPFGQSPAEGNNSGGTDTAIEFGKSLAKAQSQGIASTQKAADIYFK